MDKLRQELSPLHIGKALDVATRDGAFAKEMYAGFGSCREIVALDRSDKMFEKGREKCAGMPVNFVLGDACHMDFEDNTFDVVAIGNSLHHIPDLAALLAEMKRVVKPDGLIILSEMYNDGQPKASLTHWILHDIDCTMHTIDGIYHHPTYSKSEILWLARNAGLTVEKTLCDLIDDRRLHLARIAPRCPEIDQYRYFCSKNFLLKVILCQCHYTHLHSCFVSSCNN